MLGGCCVALASVSLATAASADELYGTRSAKLKERAHTAQLTMYPGYARLRVRRTVHNGGARHDQAVFRLDVPAGAAAIGLRTLGSVQGRPQWFAGELMESEKAAARYRELTGLGGAFPKDPALLSWRTQKELTLQVFPVAPSTNKTVEYTYLLPTEYRQGAHHLVLPPLGSEALRATLRARSAHGEALLIDDKPQTGAVISSPSKLDVALVPHRAPTIGGALAVVPVGAQRVLTRIRIEAAPKLSTVPRHARIVVVIDTSRSLAEDQLGAQLVAAQHYLRHFADARVEVLTFDRKVRARHWSFVSSARAVRDLANIGLVRRNGSEVEEALLRAHALLEGIPKHHPKRILLLTDTHTRSAITAHRLRASISEDTLMHVGVLSSGAPALERDLEHDWSELTRSTGGLVWSGTAHSDPQHERAMRHVFEEWARPVRLHVLVISAPRIDMMALLSEEILNEGEGITEAWFDADATPWLKVEGLLWAKPITRVLRPDAAEGKRWSALAFGSDLLHELSEEEMMTLAMRGGAVSPVTSFLAIEPGVRPSTEGLEWGQGFGAGGFGLRGGGTGGGGAWQRPNPKELQAFLAAELGAARRACGIASSTTKLSLQTTFAEIVAVHVLGSASDAEKACLENATWQLQLPSMFRHAHHSWQLPV
jgi:hypothetical protein